MAKFIVVETTVESRNQAEGIAAELVDRQLAACVQIVGPITSIFRWRGETENSEEFLCLIKTRQELFGAVEKLIATIHSYEEPQIIATEIIAGSSGYLDWLQQQTERGKTD